MRFSERPSIPLWSFFFTPPFLSLPFERIRDAFEDVRFVVAVVVLNFVVVPMVVFVLSRLVASDPSLFVGVLLVLLCPCIDYVMVFTRLAEGAWEKLLAVSPLLMLLQMTFLPLYLLTFAGDDIVKSVEPMPFVGAFILLIVLPLALSAVTRRLARRFIFVRRGMQTAEIAMIPLMMVTLFVVVASQTPTIIPQIGLLSRVVPIYLMFLLVMPLLGAMAGRLAHQGEQARRALAFSCSTRNSLVVLPLALALPDALSLAAGVVVTQTLVELLGMVTFVHVFPHLIRDGKTRS